MNVDPADKVLFDYAMMNLAASQMNVTTSGLQCCNECYSDYRRLANMRMSAICKRIQRDRRDYK